jgi:hypothetical protein
MSVDCHLGYGIIYRLQDAEPAGLWSIPVSLMAEEEKGSSSKSDMSFACRRSVDTVPILVLPEANVFK